jgi:MFS transporter, Spinster family, sphingosine-1-phosphate transporter
MHVSEEDQTEAAGVAPSASRWAIATFIVLFAMNLLDYIDRWVLAAVLPDIQREFKINDLQAGLFNTYFLVSYSLISPIMGWAGDRVRRTRLLFIGVGLWSLATLGTGFARNPTEVAFARSLLGIGEATYGVIAPTILMDLFARRGRARVMSAFYLAMPIGGALGMFLGAYVAQHHGGWRNAFFVVGVPGLIAAFSALFLREPIRGASEGVDAERLKLHERAGASSADYVDLAVNSSYTYSVFGMAAYTFAIGGLAYWFPKFLTITRGLERVRASTILGIVTALAAISGMTLGGWLADRLAKTNPRALFIVPGVAMLASLPFMVLGLFSKSEPAIFAGIFLAEALMFMNTGPCNAVIANVVAPNLRAAAYAIAIFAVHFLGDIWSPTLMGWVADTFGRTDTMATSFGRALASIGAAPTVVEGGPPENLLAGMLVVIPAVLLSGIVLLAGARHLPREMAHMLAKLRSVPRPASAAAAVVPTSKES